MAAVLLSDTVGEAEDERPVPMGLKLGAFPPSNL